MVCIFCVAAFVAVVGAMGGISLAQIEGALQSRSKGPVQKTSESSSVVKYEANVTVLTGKVVPVAVTIYKEHNRVRIQLLTHELSRAEIEKVEDEIAEMLQARIVIRSDPETEKKVHEAFRDELESDAAERIVGSDPRRRGVSTPPSIQGG
ncbi:MAG: hypothetical protein ABR505_05740 [Actinomycetota bacterium]